MAQSLPLLLGAFALVLLNGFFVTAEFALVKVRRTRIHELVEAGDWRARVAAHLIDHLDAYLSATQLGITFASIGLGWIGEPAVAHLLEPLLRAIGVVSAATIHGISLAVAFLIVSFLHIVLGELAPKSIAIRKPETTALWVAAPLIAFYYLFYPFIFVLNGTANALLHAINIPPAGEAADAPSAGELQLIVAASHAHGLLAQTASGIIEKALRFSERRVAELMVPRTEIVWIDESMPIDRVHVLVGTSPFSHFPVCRGNLDQIIGIVHIKDLIAYGLLAGQDFKFVEVARPPRFIPGTMPAIKLLDQFRTTKVHVAIVVDEYGSVRGLITLNDLMTALLGDISRPGEEPPPRARRRADGSWLFDGRLPLAEMLAVTGATPGTDVKDVSTVAGLVLSRLGRIPAEGESLSWQGWLLEVVDMDGTRVDQVLAKRERLPR